MYQLKVYAGVTILLAVITVATAGLQNPCPIQGLEAILCNQINVRLLFLIFHHVLHSFQNTHPLKHHKYQLFKIVQPPQHLQRHIATKRTKITASQNINKACTQAITSSIYKLFVKQSVLTIIIYAEVAQVKKKGYHHIVLCYNILINKPDRM